MTRHIALLAACLAAGGTARAETMETPPGPASAGASVEAPAASAASVPTISLREALRRAERDPPSVLAAVAALDRADASETLAEVAWLPVLSVQATAGIAYDNRLVIPNFPRIDSKSLSTQGSAQLDWTALNLARSGNIDAARAGRRAQGYGKEAAQRAAMVLAAEMYVRAQAASELVKDAELSLERRTSQHEGILALTKTGLRQPVEAQRAEVEAVSARYVLAARRDEEVAAWASLAAAMGRSPTSPLRPEGPAGEALDVVFPPAVARELALRHRPERKQSVATVVQREGEHSAATGARLPTLGVQGQTTLSYFDNIGGFGVTGYQFNAGAFAYMRWSGLDPAVWFRAGVTEAAAVESRRQLDAMSLALAAEAVQSAHAMIRAKTERDRAVAVLEAARVTREAQNGRYRAGLASLLELLDAENLEQDARRRRIESDRDYQIAGARLLSSCGLLPRLTR